MWFDFGSDSFRSRPGTFSMDMSVFPSHCSALKRPRTSVMRSSSSVGWWARALMAWCCSSQAFWGLEARLTSSSPESAQRREQQQDAADPLVQVIVTYKGSWVASNEALAYTASYQSRSSGSVASLASVKSVDSSTARVWTSSSTSSWAEGPKVTAQFQKTNAVAMTLSRSQLMELQQDPRVALVETEQLYYPMQTYGSSGPSEVTPWGITAIQGDTTAVPAADTSSNCFQVCVIDSGLYVAHPDIPYHLGDSTIKGQNFGVPDSQPWYYPADSAPHGTHVTGIILAQGGNNVGTVGIIPRNQNICLLVARVFGDGLDGQSGSSIQSAVEWCASNQARVINMSMGAPGYSPNMADLYKNLRQEGILVFAASGNTADSTLLYPAAYQDVVSVAAVDSNLQRAYFSTYNSQVNLTAPGVNIYSTVPASLVIGTGFSLDARVMQYSLSPPNPVVGGLINCGVGTQECTSAAGQICLFNRGQMTFDNMASNCQRNGGLGVIVYNNNPYEATFLGALNYPTSVTIPCVSVSAQAGATLLQAHAAAIYLPGPGYINMSGTSMATPHVAGAATKIWAARPQCTAEQVLQALYATARDVGPSGSDVFSGIGLVQTESAYKYLLTLPAPCGLGSQTSASAPQQQLETSSTQTFAPGKVSPGDDNTKDNSLRLSNDGRVRGTTRGLKGSRRW